MKIKFSPPFVDQSVIDEVMDTLQSGWITTGPKVAALEKEMRELTGCGAAVCVNSWTSAAILMLKWFGVGQGDEVIIPAYTYSATALAVLHCGARPVMVDIGDDLTMDTAKVREAITSQTKVIMPVDIAGWPCDYDELGSIVSDPDVRAMFTPASKRQRELNRILVMSDAAHSIGSLYGGRPTALKADVTLFSFHAVKNVTTAEGGCICLNLPGPFEAEEEYRYLRVASLNGQTKSAFEKQAGSWKYDILFEGFKFNMPDICAAIGLAQIRKYTSELLPARKRIAFQYLEAFARLEWFVPPALLSEERESSYHLFPLRIRGIDEATRDQIIARLTAAGVAVNVHFIPLPMLTCFRDLGYDVAHFPESYSQYASEISLPIYPQLEAHEVEYIIDNVVRIVESHIEVVL